MNVLLSKNKVRGFAAHTVGKKNVNLVSPNEVHDGRKLREKVINGDFKTSLI